MLGIGACANWDCRNLIRCDRFCGLPPLVVIVESFSRFLCELWIGEMVDDADEWPVVVGFVVDETVKCWICSVVCKKNENFFCSVQLHHRFVFSSILWHCVALRPVIIPKIFSCTRWYTYEWAIVWTRYAKHFLFFSQIFKQNNLRFELLLWWTDDWRKQKIYHENILHTCSELTFCGLCS